MTTGPEPLETVEPPGALAAVAVPLAAGALAGLVFATGAQDALFHAVNEWPAVTGDAPWASLSVLGEGAAVLALSALLVGRRPRRMLAVVVATLLCAATLQAIKHLVGAPRPLRVFGADAVHVIGPELSRNSFPSGHSVTAFAAAALAWGLVRGPWARSALLALASLVALSRLAVGAHFPLDALAGAALGWSCGVAALQLVSWSERKPDRWLRLATATLPLAAAVYVAIPDEGEGLLIVRPLLAAFGLVAGAPAWLREWRRT